MDMSLLRQEYPDFGEQLDAFNASVVALPISHDQMAHIINMNNAVMIAYGHLLNKLWQDTVDAAFKRVSGD